MKISKNSPVGYGIIIIGLVLLIGPIGWSGVKDRVVISLAIIIIGFFFVIYQFHKKK